MNEHLVGAGSPSQQLGAVPGTADDAVLGYGDIEPEIDPMWDAADFASSGEAEIAPRDDLDAELPESVLFAARMANNYGPMRRFVTTREAENLGYGGPGGMDYESTFSERVHEEGAGRMDYRIAVDVPAVGLSPMARSTGLQEAISAQAQAPGEPGRGIITTG